MVKPHQLQPQLSSFLFPGVDRRITRLSNRQVIESPGYRIIGLSNHWIIESLDYRVIGLSNHWVIELSKHSNGLSKEHIPPSSKPMGFILKDYRSNGTNVMENTSCHLFTKELSWMESFIREVNEGTIPCPKCNGKLGTFSWVGIQCSCGEWVVPGFALHRTKIDIFNSPL